MLKASSGSSGLTARHLFRIRAQSAGMLKPTVLLQLIRCSGATESHFSFPAANDPSNWQYCALFAGQSARSVWRGHSCPRIRRPMLEIFGSTNSSRTRVSAPHNLITGRGRDRGQLPPPRPHATSVTDPLPVDSSSRQGCNSPDTLPQSLFSSATAQTARPQQNQFRFRQDLEHSQPTRSLETAGKHRSLQNMRFVCQRRFVEYRKL